MRVKTFRGENTRAAMNLVKAEFGSDAVILSTRSFHQDGCSICEIMAAVESQAGEKPELEAAFPAPPADSGKTPPKAGAEVLQDLSGEQNKEAAPERTSRETKSPGGITALQFLENEGVSTLLIRRLGRELLENGSAGVLSALDGLIRTRPFTEDYWEKKFHCLTGPCGSGKTTALLRLALSWAENSNPERICVVNADAYQAHGRLVLRHYSELGHLTYKEAFCEKDFLKLKRESRNFDKIFIDAPAPAACNNFDTFIKELLGGVLEETDVHLTLSASTSSKSLERQKRSFASDALSSLIWTRLDEAEEFGPLLNVTYSLRIPISALSFAPGICDRIVPAEPRILWPMIFKRRYPQTIGLNKYK